MFDDMKESMNKLIEAANSTLHGTIYNDNDSNNLVNKMIKRLSDNINNTFEHNANLGQDCLKCKTAADTIELHRNYFECNYKNMVKTYMDLLHDVQKLTNHNIKSSCDCIDKNVKCFSE